MTDRIGTFAELECLAQLKADEHGTREFKTTGDDTEWWKIAADVAAFANAFGGTIIVGAKQGNDKTLSLQGMDPNQYAETKKRYENAVKDHTRPTPLVTYQDPPIIHPETGRMFLIVYVQPYIAALVGAEYPAYPDYKPGETLPQKLQKAQGADAWQFPLRRDSNNVPLNPDQFPLHMNPQIRRTIILINDVERRLQRVFDKEFMKRYPRGSPYKLRPDAPGCMNDEITSISVAPFWNNVHIKYRREGQNLVPLLVLPIDDVDTVYAEDDYRWRIRLRGRYVMGPKAHEVSYLGPNHPPPTYTKIQGG